jgi:hypothetical protein
LRAVCRPTSDIRLELNRTSRRTFYAQYGSNVQFQPGLLYDLCPNQEHLEAVTTHA